MALEIEKGYEKLVSTILLGNAGYHQDYKKVNRLANLYSNLITGDDPDKLLKRFTPREDVKQFNQRVRLTHLLTPAIAEKIMQPFYKVSRIDNVKKGITFVGKENEDVDDKIKTVQTALDGYYGDEGGLEDFMETEYVDLVFTDPNSFILTEFDEFDSDTEKASPFPFIVSSEEAINYKYRNNVLQFLIIEKKITFKSVGRDKKVTIKEGSKYRMYLDNQVVILTEVDANGGGTEALKVVLDEIDETTTILIGSRAFKIEINEHGAGQIPAIRTGYKRDISTKGRTMVSPMHKAVPRMMKTVKSVSEMDLTTTLHTFPQKIQYVEACKGVPGDVCRKGKNSKNSDCKACNGTGLSIHKSSTDVVTFTIPSDPKDMMELDKLLVYKNPPVDLIKWQDDYIDKLEIACLNDIFVSNTLRQNAKTQTATELDYDMENIYDTLFPFAKKYSAVYIKQGKLSAIYVDNENAIIFHKFPKDFKLKTEKALLADLKAAKDADAPPFLKMEIENDIAVKVYADQPDKLREYKVKQQHIPFSGKTPEEITMSINMGLTTKFDKILYANFDSIITEINQEQIKEGKDFYLMSYDARTELIKAKVDQYNQRIEAERSSSKMFNTMEELEQEKIDAENERTEVIEEGNEE